LGGLANVAQGAFGGRSLGWIETHRNPGSLELLHCGISVAFDRPVYVRSGSFTSVAPTRRTDLSFRNTP
jgi:hypothetical protein